MFKSQFFKFIGLFFVTSFLISCGEKESSGPANVTVKLPKKLESQKLNASVGTLAMTNQAPDRVRAFSDIWSPAFAPASTSELNCFGVVIGGPEDSLNQQVCGKTAGGEITFGVKATGGLPGQDLVLQVEDGEDRQIHVLGWKAENDAACETLRAGTAVEAKQLSHPFLIASVTQDLPPGDVEIAVTASLTGAEELVNCDVFEPKVGSLSTRTFTLGGIVSGNKEVELGENLILQVNGSGGKEIFGNGPFTLDDVVGDAVEFNVSIAQQPAGKTCEISNNSGTIDGDNFGDILVSCEDIPLTVGGTVMGLDNFDGRNLRVSFNASNSSVLEEGTETLEITENGAFQFTNTLLHNSAFAVFVSQQPIGETCVVSNGSGIANGVNITNVVINCSTNIFPVGGTVIGLLPGERPFTLENTLGEAESGEELVVDQNGGYVFINGVEFNTEYNVTVKVQPPGMNCTVANGTGIMGEGDVNNVDITCVPLLFNVGGTISGMVPNRAVDLSLSFDTTSLTESFIENGSFTFFQQVPSGTAYAAAIATLPIGHACSIANATGEPFASDITNLVVNCVAREFTIGGQLNGLIAGRSVTLQNNAGDDIVLTADGAFNFPTQVLTGQFYDVTVAVQPPGQSCTVTNGNAETLGNTVNNISVDCVPLPFNVGGTISGLVLSQQLGISIAPSEGAPLVATVGNGAYVAGTILSELTYIASIATPATGHDCVLSNTTGQIFASDVTNIDASCTPQTFQIGGAVSGLIAGRSLTVQNNSGDNLVLNANSSYNFATEIAFGSNYAVTVLTQPPGMNCTVANASGTVTSAAAVTNANITCVPLPFNVGGTVTGLVLGQQIELEIDPSQGSTLTTTIGNGSYVAGTVLSGETYSTEIIEDALGHDCIVSNGSGTVFDQAVTNIDVACTPQTFEVGGTLTGLISGRSVTIQNNGGDDLVLTADDNFTFATEVAFGNTYSASILNQPAGQTCTLTNASGTITDANDISDITLTCVPDNFDVSVTVTGLIAGRSVTLQNNTGDDLVVSDNGVLTTFSQQVASGTDYDVTVSSQPVGETCSVSNDSGTIFDSAITDVTVTCVPDSFTIGGSVVGHPAGGATLVLQNNTGDDLSITDNGSFTFATAIESGQNFDITVLTNPVDHTCTVSGGSGTVLGVNITTPVVTCIEDTFSVGGTVTGLADGETLTIDRSEAETLNILGDGNPTQVYTFVNELVNGAGYAVFVVTQPSGQTCVVSNASGTIAGADVTNVDITCTDNPPVALGQVDTSFQNAGTLNVLSTNTNDLRRSRVELDANEKLNVAFADATNDDLGVCRFEADGSVDTSFNSGTSCNVFTGTEIGGDASVEANDMKLDASGRMVVTGSLSNTSMFVSRILADGSGVDTSFAGGTVTRTNSCQAGQNEDRGNVLAIDSFVGGAVFTAGHSTINGTEALASWKFNDAGQVAASFNLNGNGVGVSCFDVSAFDSEAYGALIIDSSNRLVGAGSNLGDRTEVKAFNRTSGAVDTSFGASGVVSLDPVPGSIEETPVGLVEDSQGRYYVAGKTSTTSYVIRLLASGSVDTSWGSSGTLLLSGMTLNSIALDAAENVLVAGEEGTSVIKRFDSAGALDASFGASGELFITLEAGVTGEVIEDMTVDSAGNIFVSASVPTLTGERNIIVVKIK